MAKLGSAALLALVLAVGGACANTPPSAGAPERPFIEAAGGDVLRETFRHVRDRYVRTVTVRAFALEGMKGLAKIDAAVGVQAVGNTLVVSHGGRRLSALPAPGPNDAEAWAGTMVEVVRAAATASEPVRAAPIERIHVEVLGAALTSLDSFSRYVTPADARDNRALRNGYGGIGITVQSAPEGVKAVSVMPGTPAEQAGVKAGDLITRIDGKPIAGQPLSQIVQQLRGREGSTVTLTVVRQGQGAPLDIAVTRRHINPTAATYERRGDLAYIRVLRFLQGTSREVHRAVLQARREIGGELAGIVLDLRDNPGGLLDQAIALSDLFLADGRIVATRGRHHESQQGYEARPGDVANGLPIVVLINGRSASSSEIVAAALQDNGRAVIVGSNSYGKGTVQTVFTLPNDGELVLTWSRFHAPSGYALEGLGVLPNVCTGKPGATDRSAIRSLAEVEQTANVFRRWRTFQVPDPGRAQALRATCPSTPPNAPAREGGRDIDFEVARALLKEQALYRRALAAAALGAAYGKHGLSDTNDTED
jgi:carboxyl-terminal processing protease